MTETLNSGQSAVGSGCDSVRRDPLFESSHRQNFIQVTCFIVNCWTNGNKGKEAGKGTFNKAFYNETSVVI